jgi:hypothetical protein
MKPSTTRVLRALEAAGLRGCTTAELCQPEVGGVRFGGRIHELIHDFGCVIERDRIRQGSHHYILRSGIAEVGAVVRDRGADLSDGRGATTPSRPAAEKVDGAAVGATTQPLPGSGGTLSLFGTHEILEHDRQAA